MEECSPKQGRIYYQDELSPSFSTELVSVQKKATDEEEEAMAMEETGSSGSGYGDSDGIYRPLDPSVEIPSFPHYDLPSCIFSGPVGSPENSSKLLLVDASNPSRKLTCGEFRRSVYAVAAGLTELGIRHGDVVMVLLGNTIYFPVIFFGILAIGAVVTTMNPSNTWQEIASQMKDSGARFIVTTLELLDKIKDASMPPLILLLGDSERAPKDVIFTPFAKLLKGDPNYVCDVRIRQADTAALLYSSGTTGRSKGVVLSHGNLIAAVSILNSLQERDPDRVFITLMPLFHVAGLVWQACGRIREAATLVVLPRFDILKMFETIQRFRVTDLPLVPPIVVALSKHPAAERYDLSSVKRAGSGAAPLAGETIDTFLRRYPQIQEFAQGYGMTETSGLGCAGASSSGSAGRLMPNVEAKVVDVETGKPQPPNHRGELWLRGPIIMQGYWNNPVATAETIDKDGWLHTGDLVYFDTDGYVYVVDRLKELIKYKGFQVAPAELEALLLTHPAISDSAVIPFPDEDAGEVPMAFVVRGESGKHLTGAEVMDFIAGQVASHKKIRKVEFLKEIPKSPSGKILRKDLIKLIRSRSKL